MIRRLQLQDCDELKWTHDKQIQEFTRIELRSHLHRQLLSSILVNSRICLSWAHFRLYNNFESFSLCSKGVRYFQISLCLETVCIKRQTNMINIALKSLLTQFESLNDTKKCMKAFCCRPLKRVFSWFKYDIDPIG